MRIQRARLALRPSYRTSAQTKQNCRRIVEKHEADLRVRAVGVDVGRTLVYDSPWPDGLEVHVALLAWRRPQYLERTLKSFFRHNDASRFHLWSGFDAGADPRVRSMAEAAGFVPIVAPRTQLGYSRMWAALFDTLAEFAGPEDLLLHLEEDWESHRPLPVGLAHAFLTRGARFVRLFGKYRERGRGGVVHQRGEWRKVKATCGGAAEDVAIGRGWYANPPCLTTPRFAAWAHAGTTAEKQVIRRTFETPLAWPATPTFWHIGAIRSSAIGGRG